MKSAEPSPLPSDLPSATASNRELPLRRDLRWWRFLAAHAVASVADQVGLIAVPVFVLWRQGAAAMGVFLGVAALTLVVLLPVGGMLADAAPRGAVIRLGYLLSAISPALLLFSPPGPGLLSLVAAAVTSGGGGALVSPALRAGLADLVHPRHLAKTYGTLAVVQNIVAVVAPALSGITILSWSADGLLSAQLSACVLAACCTPRLPRSHLTSTGGGIRFLRRGMLRKAMRPLWLRAGIIQTSIQVALGFAPGLVLIRVVGTERYGIEGFGLILSASAAAALVGTSMAALRMPSRPGLWANLGFVAYVPVFVLLAVEVPLPLFLAAIFVGGVGISLHGVWWYTALNDSTAEEARGRVNAVDASVTRVLEPLGLSAAVPVAGLIGISGLAGLGAAVFTIVPLLTLAVPGFIRYGRRTSGGEADELAQDPSRT